MKALEILQVVLAGALLHQVSGSVSRASAPGSALLVKESVTEAKSVYGDAVDTAGGGRRVARYWSPFESVGKGLESAMNLKTIKALGEDVEEIRNGLSNQYNSNYESMVGALRRGQQSVSDQFNSGLESSQQVYEFLRSPERVCKEIGQRVQAAYSQAGDSLSGYTTRPMRGFLQGFASGRN